MRRSIAGVCAIAVLFFTGMEAQTASTPPKPAKPGLALTTTAFEDGGILPIKYTASAAPAVPVSPELAWSNIPDGVVSFVLTMHDPDNALNKRTDEVVLHWLMFNIPGTSRGLPEGVPVQPQLPDGSIQLPNRQKRPGYQAPGQSAAGPYHHYTFELYALDTKLNLGTDATEADIFSVMQGHILAKAVLVTRFHRP